MMIGVRSAIDVARSWSGEIPGTVTEAGGIGGPSPTGAVLWRSSRFRPRTPAAIAATPTPPARMMNERRDQSGIRAAGRPSVVAAFDARERSRSQPRTQIPAPTEMAVAAAATPTLTSGSPSDATKPTTPKMTNTATAIS
jgi:hypothetical protein